MYGGQGLSEAAMVVRKLDHALRNVAVEVRRASLHKGSGRPRGPGKRVSKGGMEEDEDEEGGEGGVELRPRTPRSCTRSSPQEGGLPPMPPMMSSIAGGFAGFMDEEGGASSGSEWGSEFGDGDFADWM